MTQVNRNQLFNRFLQFVVVVAILAWGSTARLYAQAFAASCPVLFITPTVTVPDIQARVGTAFTKQIIATGGITPYQFTLTSGPAGMTVGATTGVVSWTPPSAGLFAYQVSVVDSEIIITSPGQAKNRPRAAFANLNCTIDARPVPSAACPTEIRARVGVTYSQAATLTPSFPPGTFTLTNGPAGLSLVGVTVTGTLSTPGTFTYTLTVSDSGPPPNSTSVNCTIQVRAPLTILCPVPLATVGVPYTGQLNASGGYPLIITTGSTSIEVYSFTLVSGPPNLTVSTTGAVAFTPPTVSVFQYVVQVADVGPTPNTAQQTCQVDARGVLTIACPTNLQARTGILYTGQVTATGGFGNNVFSLVSTQVSGLLISSAGAVTATPTAAGTFTFRASVTDGSNTNAIDCSLDVRVPLQILCPVPNAIAGVQFSRSVSATGGFPTYTFTLVSGPAGLTVAPGGLVVFTPPAAAITPYTVQVSDTGPAPNTAQQICEIDARAAIQILCPVPNATSGVLYQQSIAISGGFPGYTITLTSGPAGLTVNASGVVTFTPPAPGLSTYAVQVVDSEQNPATQTCEIDARAPLSLACPANTSARPGVSYTGNLVAAGGFPPYTFTLVQPAAGLAISSAGVVSFLSQATGSVTYTATVSDQSAALNAPASATCTITVVAQLQFICPVDRPAQVGSFYSADLSAVGGFTPYTFALVSSTAPGAVVSGRNFSFRATQAGIFTYTASVTDAGTPGVSPETVTGTCNATVDARPIQLFCGLGLPGRVGQPFSQQFIAEGGVPPFRWALTGNIPGLSFDTATGILSGTPTRTGNFNVGLSVEDTVTTTASTTCGVRVEGLPLRTDASCGTLGVGRVGSPYEGTLQVSGGVGPYFWQLTTGNLPGLTVNPNGTVTGQPTTAGQFPFTATVRDSGGEFQQTQTVSCRIFVNENRTPLNASCGTLPQGRQGEPYAGQLLATGGRDPYTWTLSASSDRIPGLTLNPDGSLTGRAETAGAFRLVARVRDSATGDQAQEKEVTCGVSVESRPGGMNLSCGTLTTVRMGQPFPAFPLTVTGGEAPYSFNVIRGVMPPGLQIANGAISGTPIDRGSFAFTIEARDSAAQLQQSARAACTMEVLPEALTAACGILPNGRVGRQYTAQLNAKGGVTPFNWTLEPGAALPAGLTLSGDGQIWGIPASTVPAPVAFNVRVTDAANGQTQQTAGPLACSLNIPAGDLPAPAVNSTVTTTQFPTQPARFSVTLTQAVPETLRGRATLRFTGTPGNAPAGYFDPAIRFGALEPCGGVNIDAVCRTLDFLVPPNTTQVILPADGQIIQGTVAGNLLVNLTFPAESNQNVIPPADQQRTIPVGSLAPVIDSVDLFPLTGGFEVEIAGYSTPRSLTRADVTLNLDGSTEQFQVSLDAAANAWYSSEAGRAAGGQFRLRIPFEFGGAASQEIRSVQVTLANSAGSTQANPVSFR
jgi:hypothetical protein